MNDRTLPRVSLSSCEERESQTYFCAEAATEIQMSTGADRDRFGPRLNTLTRNNRFPR